MCVCQEQPVAASSKGIGADVLATARLRGRQSPARTREGGLSADSQTRDNPQRACRMQARTMGNSPHIPYTGQGRREESCGSLAHAPRPPTHAPVACVPREGEQARRTAASPSTRGQSKRCNDLVPELKDDAPLILPADRNVEECALHHGRLFSIRRANALSAEKLGEASAAALRPGVAIARDTSVRGMVWCGRRRSLRLRADRVHGLRGAGCMTA